jgi:hypothetical protein
MNNNPSSSFEGLITEVAELNRQLLLLQISQIEDEIIPCKELLQTLDPEDSPIETVFVSFFHELQQKISRLRHLKAELNRTEKLARLVTAS